MKDYREKFIEGADAKDPTSDEIYEAKSKNQEYLVEYEQQIEKFVKFLDEDVTKYFEWSESVKENI